MLNRKAGRPMKRNPDGELLHGNAETLVLAVLARGESHGYQLRKDLAIRSKSHFHIGFGRLYPLLALLERRGQARARWMKAGPVRQRKMYAITAKGRAHLQEKIRKWRQFSAAMERVLSK
jgi:DNA-binding PadR family transcriptional regulator